ncbi:hypothetical protein VE02_08603 [Pseudogymnoascus sp. 03VT05]|nr:hypothetical protein VE02_08603 [Pseudogymnoascus sp. 03VT05]
MAEAIAGLAVATSIITVIDTTCKVVAMGWRCYREIKTAPKELVEVMSELMSLQGILNTLHSHLSTSHDHNSKDFLALEMLNQPDGVLAACAVVLQDVLRIIEGLKKKKLGSVIAAATSGQKFLEAKSRIERLKSLLMLALSSDHITLSHAIEEHLHLAFGELKHGQEKIHCELLNIDNRITKLSLASDEIASSRKVKHEAHLYYETLRWLSTVDFEANHSNACRLQQRGTGLWLIDGEDFSEWAKKDHSTFWLHAIPGAGTTILWFRWVVCQLDALKPLGRPKAIRNALKSLPQTLDESYDRILLAIQSEEEKELIRRTFQFIIFAIRPMTMEEIAEAVVVEDSSTALDPDDRYHTPEHLLKNVRSLLTTTGGHLGLSHYSVQEYLQSPRISKSPASYFAMTESNANEEIGRTCLTYLAYDDFNDGPCESDAELELRLVDYPFLGYAANSWFLHSREEQAQRSVASLFDKIWTIVESPKYLSWYQAFWDETITLERKYDTYKTTNPPILYYPALWGLHVLLQRLLIDDADVNIQGGYYGQALQSAAINQNHQCFKLLLDHGADVHAQGGYFGNALQASAFVGCEDIVKALVDRNCRVNTKEGIFGNALYAASSGGHTGTVRMLIEAGADVNSPRETNGGRPFRGSPGYPLHVAASNGHYLTCKTLIDKGALVNAQWEVLGGALHEASFNGRTRVVELLLERGAEVNVQGGARSNPIVAACYNGHEQVVRLLLIHGADAVVLEVSTKTYHCRQPHYGADANEEDGFYGNPLQGAAYRGQERAVETLLSFGADINRAGVYFGSALHAACRNGSIIIAEMLLNRGADPNFLADIHGKPLQFAASFDEAEIVQLLLESAKVNAVGGRYDTALHAAAHQGYEDIVEILLMAGADAVIVGEKYGSALDAAVLYGRTNVAERLRKAEREKEAFKKRI